MTPSQSESDGLWENLRREKELEEEWMSKIPGSSEREGEDPAWISDLEGIDLTEARCEEYNATEVYRTESSRIVVDSKLSEDWGTEVIEGIEKDMPCAYFNGHMSQDKVSRVMYSISKGRKLDSAITGVYESNRGVAERLRGFTDESGTLQEKYREDFRRISKDKVLTGERFWAESDMYWRNNALQGFI